MSKCWLKILNSVECVGGQCGVDVSSAGGRVRVIGKFDDLVLSESINTFLLCKPVEVVLDEEEIDERLNKLISVHVDCELLSESSDDDVEDRFPRLRLRRPLCSLLTGKVLLHTMNARIAAFSRASPTDSYARPVWYSRPLTWTRQVYPDEAPYISYNGSCQPWRRQRAVIS